MVAGPTDCGFMAGVRVGGFLEEGVRSRGMEEAGEHLPQG